MLPGIVRKYHAGVPQQAYRSRRSSNLDKHDLTAAAAAAAEAAALWAGYISCTPSNILVIHFIDYIFTRGVHILTISLITTHNDPVDGGWMGWCPMSLSLARKRAMFPQCNIQTVIIQNVKKRESTVLSQYRMHNVVQQFRLLRGAAPFLEKNRASNVAATSKGLETAWDPVGNARAACTVTVTCRVDVSLSHPP
jgi:hypothetical protein